MTRRLTGERRDRHRGLPGQVAGNLRAPIPAFDADTRDVIEKFDFDAQIGRLDRAKEGERTTWPSAQCT